VRFSPGPAVASNGRRTSTQRNRAAMAGDEHSPVRLRFHHLYLSTQENEWSMMVGSVSPESSPLVS